MTQDEEFWRRLESSVRAVVRDELAKLTTPKARPAPAVPTPEARKAIIVRLAKTRAKAQRGMLPKSEPGKPVNWREVEKTCPRCGAKGHVIPDFGVRVLAGGREKVQSWCLHCRSTVSYYVPRR